MGLILLVLIGFLPTHYALDLNHPARAQASARPRSRIRRHPRDEQPDALTPAIRPTSTRSPPTWRARRASREVPAATSAGRSARRSIRLAEDSRPSRRLPGRPRGDRTPHAASTSPRRSSTCPTWVVVGVALAPGLGTTVGYKRIVVTVAEKIGKAHLTYAQGAAAEVVAAATIGLADVATCRSAPPTCSPRAWPARWGRTARASRARPSARSGSPGCLTLPAAILLSATLSFPGDLLIPAARPEMEFPLRSTPAPGLEEPKRPTQNVAAIPASNAL